MIKEIILEGAIGSVQQFETNFHRAVIQEAAMDLIVENSFGGDSSKVYDAKSSDVSTLLQEVSLAILKEKQLLTEN